MSIDVRKVPEPPMKVLLIDKDKDLIDDVLSKWSLAGCEIFHCSGSSETIQVISQGGWGTVFLSNEFLTLDQLDTLTFIKEHNRGVEIFVLSERQNTSLTEDVVRKGAHSVLIKPLRVTFLESLVRKVMTRALSSKNHRTLEEHLMMDLLGSSPAMEKILQTITKVAPTNSTVLIEGETGTGKEFIANLVHRLSHRADESFIAINCAAIPETLIESELFGSKKGAYTGAIADRKGLFEEADSGTLFLDEIGELPMSMQVKLLRFLQEREIRRVGDTETHTVNVRVIAATNLDLARAVKEGRFREDLYYRLNTFHLNLPPLRERRGNIPHLIRFFVKKYSREHNIPIKGIAKDAEAILLNYDYPGNIRELENVIEHAVVLCEGEYILRTHLPEVLLRDSEQVFLSLPKSGEVTDVGHILSLADMEKQHIIHALQVLENNQTEVAKRLDISRSTLWRKIKEHGIAV